MNMLRFITVARIEKESIRTGPQDRRYAVVFSSEYTRELGRFLRRLPYSPINDDLCSAEP